MTAYEPVTTLEDLNSLDEAEMVEGYRDGFADEPEPSGNRSRAYWHGWLAGCGDRTGNPAPNLRELAALTVKQWHA
jgi:hypothetical protein